MKRRWFQIHLSTAILLTIVPGAFIGANLSALRHGKPYPGFWEGRHILTTFEYYGWPYIAATKTIDVGNSFIDTTLQFHWPNVALNVAAMLVVVVSLYLAAEFLIRRRGARKP